MTIYEQKKLFSVIETWQDVKNMGMVISMQHTSGACYTNYYLIHLKKSILDFISVQDLKNIIENKFTGYYGGRFDYFNIYDNTINIKYVGYND